MFIRFIIFIVIMNNTDSIQIRIQNKINNKLNHFWESTGLCPSNPQTDLFSKDNYLNFAYISALPNAAIKYIRVHWLLDLIKYRNDFLLLDKFITILYNFDLYPIFELMGNPGGVFDNFENVTQAEIFRDLVKDMALRYQVMFGDKYFKNWIFETWNEPDLKQYNTLNMSMKGVPKSTPWPGIDPGTVQWELSGGTHLRSITYLNYVRACKSGLTPTGSILGSPAGLFKNSQQHTLCWGIVEYCSSKKYCPFDFLTFHAKGNGTSEGVLNRSLEIIHELQINYSKILEMSIANDEADPLTDWSVSTEWRADTRYAAMVAKTIINYQNTMVNQLKLKVRLLSNDNAFLNYHPYYFTQRTLLARFQINNTRTPYVIFIKKPVYTVMGMFSFLGDVQVEMNFRNSLLSGISTVATGSHFRVATLIVYSNETIADGIIKKFNCKIQNLQDIHNLKYVVYILSNVQTNPYEIWQRHGSPVFPNSNVLQAIRKFEGPYLYKNLSNVKLNSKGELVVPLKLLLPSVVLIHVCGGEHEGPGEVTKLNIFNITFNEVLLIWKDKDTMSRCIFTYEVEYSFDGENFQRINENTIFNSVSYIGTNRSIENTQEFTIGSYRVRGIDYWGRAGAYSQIIRYP